MFVDPTKLLHANLRFLFSDTWGFAHILFVPKIEGISL